MVEKFLAVKLYKAVQIPGENKHFTPGHTTYPQFMQLPFLFKNFIIPSDKSALQRTNFSFEH